MTAKLTIILKADTTIVAQSDDARLWRRVLGLIQGDDNTTLNENEETDKDEPSDDFDKDLVRFAKSLGISPEELEGAISPSKEAPYFHLAHHNWEAFKKNFPSRGAGALNPTGLAATLLVLWFKEAKIDVPATQSLASGVLKTISIADPNPSRGVKNTSWLKGRQGGTITINPAEFSKAQGIVKAFCLKKGPGNES